MNILTDVRVACNANPMSPDAYRMVLSDVLGASDEDIKDFVARNAFCFAGMSNDIARFGRCAVVRYYA